MSERPRLPLATARELAGYLCRRWSLGSPERAVMGSVRRGCPLVGDLDLIAPLPSPHRPDTLYEAIAATVRRPKATGNEKGALFVPVAPEGSAGVGGRDPGCIGEAVQGLSDGFRACRLLIWGKSGDEAQVEVSRYHAGGNGDGLGDGKSNRGWVELVKTGPAEWGEAVLTWWKTHYRIPATERGSRDFFLLDGGGTRVSTPTELHAFQAARLVWVAPEQRHPDAVLCVDWLEPGSPDWIKHRAHKALIHLGMGAGEAKRAYGEQRVAVTAWKG